MVPPLLDFGMTGPLLQQQSGVAHLVSYFVEDLVHLHAGWIPVMPKPHNNHPLLLRQDGLVNLSNQHSKDLAQHNVNCELPLIWTLDIRPPLY